ncbi:MULTISPECIES: hypothetical protein [Sphingobacterium]|uniref:Uncharacterized protein n=1 Tax=Sphingobacterium athyrii TaxID=2152717 RepID=A0A363NPS2_9SPHI|nr:MULTISPECIES: hypothetical protein [Sphingobacterium]PUV22774.1 hypothetical protein DCO56_21515 [Sphingobacterium athyrii]QIH35251.1 hypothetical protein G6053_21270 [Sphingobacterium sp. DR205]
MKRLLLAALIGTAALVSFSSCKKEYVTNYLPGVSYVTPVPSNGWVRNNNNPSNFSHELKFDELDAQYFDYGHVGVAITFNYDPNKGHATSYTNIPAEYIGNYSYTFDYEVGYVIINAAYVGAPVNGTPPPPPNMYAKVTLTDADNGGN